MYPEFIAIYAGLAVVIVLLVAILVLQILILRKTDSARQHKNAPMRGAVVFCNSCGAVLEPSTRVCPKCGASR